MAQIAGIRRTGTQQGIGRLESSLQARDLTSHASNRLSAETSRALRDVARENYLAVTGAWIVRLCMECAIGQAAYAILQHVAKNVIVVVHADAGTDHASPVFARIPGQTELRSEVEIGLAYSIANPGNPSKVIEQIVTARAGRQGTVRSCHC